MLKLKESLRLFLKRISVIDALRRGSQRGQAAIEIAFFMPFFILLLLYIFNAFLSIHSAHIGQKYAAMNLGQRMRHRSKYIVDYVAGQVVQKQFLAVEYQSETGGAPRRRIADAGGQISINTNIGICREPRCQ